MLEPENPPGLHLPFPYKTRRYGLFRAEGRADRGPVRPVQCLPDAVRADIAVLRRTRMVRIKGQEVEPECHQLERGARQGGIEKIRVGLYERAACQASRGNKRCFIRVKRLRITILQLYVTP